MPDCDVSAPNVQAFLKLIRFAEHYPDASDSFYDSLYGGGRFTSYTAHPNRSVTRWGHTSTAAGAYQILFSTWAEARRNGIVSDFTPAAQDRLAFERIRFRKATGAVCLGELHLAFSLLRNEWTALPGARQTRMTFERGRDAFIRYGGTPR